MRVGELKKFLSHGAIYAVGALLARVVSFVMMPIYTRALSPAEYGVVDLLDTTAAVVVNVTNVAITYSVMRFYYDEKEDRGRGRVVSTALGGLIAFGGAATALLWPLAPALSRGMFGGEQYAFALRVMALTAVFYGLVEVPMTYIRALERPGLYLVVSLARLALGLALNVAFVVYMRWGVDGVVLANAVSTGATVLALVAFTVPKTGVGFSREIFRKMLGFGLPFIPGSLAMLAMHNGDRYILNHFRPLSEVGLYGLGYKLAMIVTYAIGVPFGNVWTTRVYTVLDEPNGQQTYARVGMYFSYALLFAWLGLSAAAPELVAIAASPEFAGAAAFVPIVAGAYALREVTEFWKNAFLIKKKTRVLAATQILGAGANLVLTWVLVRSYGAMGAAWATVLTFVILLAVTATLAERDLPTRLDPTMLIRGVAAAAGIYAVALAVPALPLAAAVPVKVALTLLFPVVLVAVRGIPDDDRVAAVAYVRRLRERVRAGRAAAPPPPRTSLHS